MNKKAYITPGTTAEKVAAFSAYLQDLSAPDEGIHDDGEGSDDDDPTAKQRNDGWGDLW